MFLGPTKIKTVVPTTPMYHFTMNPSEVWICGIAHERKVVAMGY